MATGTARSSDAETSSTDRTVQDGAQRELYIQRQIDRTRRSVKLSDLIAMLMRAATITVAFLLVLIVWDHWVFPLTLWTRVIALAAMLAFWAYVVVGQLAQLIIRRINPVYAARTIEEGVPGLKNSLTNFLLLRSQRTGVRSVVYDAVGRQAAEDLTDVRVETAVDRSEMVRIGYALASLVVIGGMYSLLSPKDPWQSVRRVVMPWANIDRPSRVEIGELRVDDVVCAVGEPVSAYLGQVARVSVIVRGVEPDEEVVLNYTTADRQTVDQPVAMLAAVSGSRYEAVVPQEEAGLQQDIVFRIEAGDAVTGNYQLNLLAAPHFVIDSIAYDYPAYTGLERRIIRDRGDIRAVEGTRVTITATANQEIQSAHLRFNDSDNADLSEGSVSTSSNYIDMKPSGKTATASFQLSLPAGDRRSQRRSYEVRFTNQQGQKNERPVQHLLEVIPDLAPEIEILTPLRQEIELPADREQIVELLARDPDFGLVGVQLHMVAGGEPILKEILLDDPAGWKGNANRRFRFVPRDYGLQPGHFVTYWGTTEDNFPATATGAAGPNTTSTSKYRFVIVDPERTDRNAESAQDPENTDDGSSEETGEPTDQPSPGEDPQPDDPDSQSTEGAGESADDKSQPEPTDAGEETGESGESGNQPSGAAGSSPGDENEGSEQGTGSGNSGQSDRSNEGDEGDAGPGGSERRATDGSDDPEIFDRILERMRQADNENKSKSGDPAVNEDPEAGDSGEVTVPDGGQPAGGEAQASSEEGWNPAQHEADGKRDSSDSPAQPDKKQGDGDDRDATSGQGGQTDGVAQPEQEPAADADQQEEGPSPEPGLGDNGESGAGEGGRDEQGAPASQETNRQQPKKTQPRDQNGDESQEDEAKSPGTSKRQSDSEGDEAGDRAGGGEGGGGQGAQQPGNDSAGSSSAADDGAGAAQESGDGETSSRAGDDTTASGKTGKTGKQRGGGSTSGDPASSERSPDTSKSSPDQNNGPSQDGQQPASGAGSEGPQSSGQLPTTGGRPGESSQDRPKHIPPNSPPDEDAPNLEFADKATDMALRYLKDQQDNPDRALLDELGWSEDELRRFVERWDQLKQRSGQDAAARQELEERLDSLGLQPPQKRTRRGSAQRDPRGGLTDSANRSSPPPEYLDQVRAYQESIGRERD